MIVIEGMDNSGKSTLALALADALNLTEALEEAVRTACVARIFKQETLDAQDEALKENLTNNK